MDKKDYIEGLKKHVGFCVFSAEDLVEYTVKALKDSDGNDNDKVAAVAIMAYTLHTVVRSISRNIAQTADSEEENSSNCE